MASFSTIHLMRVVALLVCLVVPTNAYVQTTGRPTERSIARRSGSVPRTLPRTWAPTTFTMAAASVVDPSLMLGPIAVATRAKDAIKAGSINALSQLSRPLQVGVVLAAAVVIGALCVLSEVRRRAALIESGDKCMAGDDGECAVYDDKVDETPAWKLKMAVDKLAQTNILANKLAGTPPVGFTWGKIY